MGQNKEFFKKPFTEDTLVKLELYKKYLTEFVPVFLKSPKTPKILNLFDCFCGQGKDSIGNYGSPLIAVDVLKKFRSLIFQSDISINLIFNDFEKENVEILKSNVNEINNLGDRITVNYFNKDFNIFFPDVINMAKKCANLIFLDQFGIKFIDKNRFKDLISLNFTDILYFVSSNTFYRFNKLDYISNILNLQPEEIKTIEKHKIHEFICKKYSQLVPQNKSYGLAPFSLKKDKNIYGLIFGSNNPLGLEKFLRVCWEIDPTTGSANYDIEGDIKFKGQTSLFGNRQTKVELFQSELENLILSKQLQTELQVYYFMLNSGFLAKHVKPVFKKLKSESKIEIKNEAFTYNSLIKNKDRKVQNIKLI